MDEEARRLTIGQYADYVFRRPLFTAEDIRAELMLSRLINLAKTSDISSRTEPREIQGETQSNV